ncbi:MAG: sodium/proline symporter [Alphaproteobacteria bacterium]|nr:sodium/proline symporter [Alphaproteobacteria bacterium]
MDVMLISFLAFFIFFTGVGLASSFFRKNTIEDYFLASRDVPAWLVALSYGATISSGATFIGFAGLAYTTGLTALFAIVGLTIGDHIGWAIAGNRIRRKAIETKAHTYPSLVGKLGGRDLPIVTLLMAMMTVVFMGTYCSAQLVAGAKVGVALFDWDYNIFILVGAGVLLAYCWAGGIRASIWTDAVQAVMILLSLLVLVYVAMDEVGGFTGLYEALKAIDPSLVDPFQFKFLPVFVGWVFFGIGVLGQPQLMVRHMVARDDDSLLHARRIYLGWRWTVLLLATLVGFIARVMIPEGGGAFDAELSIPALWADLLSPVFVGFLVAGLFSATMSTADSLLLSASSAMTQHIFPQLRNSYMLARLGTVVVIVLVVAIALFASDNVLALVVLAWGWMAAAVAPLVVINLCGGKPGQRLSVSMMAGGFGMTLFWRYGLEMNAQLMDLVPGMITGFAIFGVSYLLEKYVKPESQKT